MEFRKKEVLLDGRTFTISELGAEDSMEIEEKIKPEDKRGRLYAYVDKCVEPKIPIEEIKKMPFRIVKKLVEVIMQLSEIGDIKEDFSNSKPKENVL